jgi:hypothetical protein
MQRLGLNYLWFKYRHVSLSEKRGVRFRITVEMRLSGLIGTASHRDMQKIQIIGFFFENIQGGSNMTGTDFFFVVSLSQGRTAAAQCGLFTHKSVPVIFEPPCTTLAV